MLTPIYKIALIIPLILSCSFSKNTLPNKPNTSITKPMDIESLERELHQLVNQERKKAGLPLLVFDQQVQLVARAHSRDMAKRDFFSHINPDKENPFDRMKKAGIVFRAAAENIAYASTIKEIHEGLMNSPKHKANILNPKLGKMGIGIAASKYGLMTTQLFKNPE